MLLAIALHAIIRTKVVRMTMQLSCCIRSHPVKFHIISVGSQSKEFLSYHSLGLILLWKIKFCSFCFISCHLESDDNNSGIRMCLLLSD